MQNIINNYINFLDKKKNIILISCIVSVILSAIAIVNIKIDLSSEGFLFPDDPKILQYSKFQDKFGSDEAILLVVKGDVFSNEYLQKIYALQQDIEEKIPYVKDITSIINVSQLYLEEMEDGSSTIRVDDLLKGFPDKKLSDDELQQLKANVLNDPVFTDQIISKDGSASVVAVELKSRRLIENEQLAETQNTSAEDDFSDLDALFANEVTSETETSSKAIEDPPDERSAYKSVYLSNQQSRSVDKAARELVETHQDEDFEIHLVGLALLIPTLINALLRDALVFMPLLLIMIVVFIKLVFKRTSAIMYSILLPGVTNICLFGLMAIFSAPITLVTNILPTIMISIGLGAIIHLLVLIYSKFDTGYTKQDALKYAFHHSSWPIILTSLTSAAGIFSFHFSAIKPMRDFGTFGAVGLIISLIFTLLVVPVLILKFPIKSQKITSNKFSLFIDKLLSKHSLFAYKIRLITLVASGVLIGVSLMGIKNVYFSHKPVDWLPEDSQFKRDTETVDDLLKGSNFLEIFIDTGEDGGVLEPNFLHKIEQLETFLYEYKGDFINVGKVMSLNGLIKKTNKLLHDNNPEHYKIPESRELVAQELLLLENGGTGTLDNFVDLNYRYYRVTVTVPDLDAVFFRKFLNKLRDEMDTLFHGKDYTYYSTGGITLMSTIIDATIQSSKISYVIAFAVITILMIILTQRILVGCMSMLPNILPIFVLLGIVGFTSINLDMFVLLIGCVLLGIAVDNTIHFIHVFSDYLKQGNDTKTAIRLTFLSTGKAMLSTSIILIGGFSILLFASMRCFQIFGFMSMIGVIVALFSDFFLTPALMIYAARFRLLKVQKSR